MGVVNLSILIEKLKKALSGEYVKKTDKASASAFGVVKVGNNISVSSGKISVPVASDSTAGVVKIGSGLAINDGTVSVTASGGMTMDELYNGNVVQGTETQYDLAHPYTDYKFLCLVTASGANTTAGGIMAVANLSTGNYNSNGTGNNVVTGIRLDSSDATKFSTPSGTGTVAVKLYGIK